MKENYLLKRQVATLRKVVENYKISSYFFYLSLMNSYSNDQIMKENSLQKETIINLKNQILIQNEKIEKLQQVIKEYHVRSRNRKLSLG